MQTQRHEVKLGCSMLLGTGKKGVLTPDADGYYELVLGAYGAYNSAGMYYDLASAESFFKPGSVLHRQINKGVLRGEYKHPEQGDMSDEQYVQRICKIDSDRVCCHIRDIRLVPGQRDEKGRPIVLVVGKVRPSGPFGDVLKDALDNPHENVYFSVRSLTMDDLLRGIKYTRNIITWDFVNEGGIYSANKFNSPSLESFSEVSITPTMLWKLAEEQKSDLASGMESADVDYNALATELGWNKTTAKVTTPIYGDW